MNEEPVYPRGREPSPNAERIAPDYPVFKQIGRTGASRYTPHVLGDKYGRVFTYWYDSISIEEYDEMRLDGQIRAGLNLIKLPARRAKWHVTCADPDIAAFVKEVIDPVWNKLMRETLLALDFGFSIFEKIWAVSYNLRVTQTQANAAGIERTYPHAIVLDTLLGLDPRTLWLLAYRRSGRFAGVEQYVGTRARIPGRKCFLFSNDKEFEELYGMSRLKPAYPYWILGKLQYENLGVYNELAAVPMRKVSYPKGATETENEGMRDNADIAIELAENLRSNTAVALPSDLYNPDATSGGTRLWDIEFLDAGRGTGAEILASIEHFNLMKLKSLLVPQLALETGSTGTYSLGEAQIDFFIEGIESLLADVLEAINNQIVAQIVKYNFGANAPRAKIIAEPIDTSLKQGLTQLVIDTLGQGRPLPLKNGNFMLPDWEWMAEASGIPVAILTEGEMDAFMKADETVNPPPPAPGGDMPFGSGPPQSGGGGGQPAAQGQTSGQQPPNAGEDPMGGGQVEASEVSLDLGDGYAIVGNAVVYVG